MANEIRHKVYQRTRETEKLNEAMAPFREQMLKIIPVQRLNHLLTLSEEQLHAMSFTDIKGTNHQQ